MCGIIGMISSNKELVYNTTKSLLNESEIRGKHATGISYIKEYNELSTIKAPISANIFTETIMPKNIGNIVIGHTRYSTSDLEYNQPLQEGDTSLVHNGVITQLPFEKWEDAYNINDFKTKNDSEILLKYIINARKLTFENSSIAAGFIARDKMYCLRNETRPLYIFWNKEIIGFASTKNIIKRAIKYNVDVMKCRPKLLYKFYMKNKLPNMEIIEIKPPEILYENSKDLQYDTVRGYSYLKGGSIKA